jgi:uncharacterized membrane protein YedE/YeeE
LPRILRTLINTSWTLLTAFAIPVLAYEQLGPFDTFSRSRELLGKRWPEQLLGAAGFGIGAGLLAIPCVILIVIGVMSHGPSAALFIAAGVISLVAVLVVSNAAEQVYRVCLYRYAVGVDTPAASPFQESDLARPFLARRRSA